MPLQEGLAAVDDCLTGYGLRDDIRIIASGKIMTGFHMVKQFALGADLCNSARGMMLSLGCIQSLICHTNHCPTGVATQDPRLVKGLVVEDKWRRVQRFQNETVHAFVDLISSAGLRSADELSRRNIYRRCGQDLIKRYDEIYVPVEEGVLKGNVWPKPYSDMRTHVRTDGFG